MMEDKKTEFRLHLIRNTNSIETGKKKGERREKQATKEGEEESTGHSPNEENEAALLLPWLYSCTLDPRSNGVEPTIFFIR